MAAVELFFSGLGWCLFALGLLSCLIPGCFRLSVIIMLLGDLALMLGILFPRMFAALAIFSHAGLAAHMYRAAGIVLALVLYAVLMLPRSRRHRRRLAAKAPGDAGEGEVHPSHASAAIFSRVKDASGMQTPGQDAGQKLFAGVSHGERQ